MADDGGIDEVLGEAELVEGLERKKFSGKKLVIAGVVAFVVILIAILAWVFLGGDDADHEEKDKPETKIEQLAEEAAKARAAAKVEEDKPLEVLNTLFVDLGTQRYNLNVPGSGSSFLQVKIILEVDRESFKAAVEAKKPRILDEFNVYMRELHPEDLNGSKGIFRLKEELLKRINQAVAPARVEDVLFQSFIRQGS